MAEDKLIFTVNDKGNAIGVGCEPPTTTNSIALGSGWTCESLGVTVGGSFPAPDGKSTAYASSISYQDVSMSATYKQQIWTSPGTKMCVMKFGERFKRYEIPFCVVRGCQYITWREFKIYSTWNGWQPLTAANLRQFTTAHDTPGVVFISCMFELNMPLSILQSMMGTQYQSGLIECLPVCPNLFYAALNGSNYVGLGEVIYSVPNYEGEMGAFGTLAITDAMNDFPNRLGDPNIGWGDTYIRCAFTSADKHPMLTQGTPTYEELAATTWIPRISEHVAYPWNAATVLAADTGDAAYNVPLFTLPFTVDYY